MGNNNYIFDGGAETLYLFGHGSASLDKIIEESMLDLVPISPDFGFRRDSKVKLLKSVSDKAVKPGVLEYLETNPFGDFDHLKDTLDKFCCLAARTVEMIEADAYLEARSYIERKVAEEDFSYA